MTSLCVVFFCSPPWGLHNDRETGRTLPFLEQALTDCRPAITCGGFDATPAFVPADAKEKVAATLRRGAAGSSTLGPADTAAKSPDKQNGIIIQTANVPQGRLVTPTYNVPSRWLVRM